MAVTTPKHVKVLLSYFVVCFKMLSFNHSL